MENSYEPSNGNGNGLIDNGHRTVSRYSPYQPCIKVSLTWLDIRVFYVRVSKCEIDDSTPEHLILKHIPLNRDTLLEVNGVRSSFYSDGVSTLLRRDRLDKKSEEATFVSTDSVRTTGSVKFEVFYKDVLVLPGVLEMSNSNNGFTGELKTSSQRWRMNCELDIVPGTGFFKGKQYTGGGGGPDSASSPAIEVYVAGCFSGTPIILTKTLHLTLRKKQFWKGMLDSIPEYDANECLKDEPAGLSLQTVERPGHKAENEDYGGFYSGTEYWEGEDGELSWFNAGVRVGVGIGLSICLGIGIGVGLLVRTYQGTTNNFRRRLL